MKNKEKKEIKRYSAEEFLSKAKELFGDIRDAEFKCSQCGHIQTWRKLREKYPEKAEYIDSSFYYSCEGRLGDEGCDWTLGGLLQIHNTEVESEFEKGKYVPVFEFNLT